MADKTTLPLVSIIIPTYNYGRFLPKALESCFEQTYKVLEIIVIDDGSTDKTREIVEGYGTRVSYVRQENSGVSAARNKGLEIATGEFVTFLDADDYMPEDAIQTRIDGFTTNPKAGTVATESYSKKGDALTYHPMFKEDRVSDRFYEDLLLGRFPLTTSTIMIRSQIAKRFKFPLGISNGEDVVYFVKIFFVAPVCYLKKPTDISVWHGDSLRHNIDELKRQGIGLVEVIFDDPFYKGALEYLRKDFTVIRYLDLFRKLSMYGEKKMARAFYRKAFRLKPSIVSRTNYLIRFVKAHF
jgi:glycosyltransferase involved in cell wall biosynthesis